MRDPMSRLLDVHQGYARENAVGPVSLGKKGKWIRQLKLRASAGPIWYMVYEGCDAWHGWPF